VRGCLTFLAVWLAIALLAIWFALPPVLGGVAGASLTAAGFTGTDTAVTVEADPPLKLATLHADEVRIKSTQAALHDLRMATVDLTLHDVSLVDRTFDRLDGTLTGVRFVSPTAGPVLANRVTVSGPPDAALLNISLSPSDVRAVATSAGQAFLGLPPTEIVLSAPDRITFTIAGRTVNGRLAITTDGALVLRPSTGSSGSIELMRPTPTLPLKLRSFAITTDGLDVLGTIDLAGLR
jgi:hypothetical protein